MASVHPDLEAAYGPPLAGVLLASFCAGLLVQQVSSYYLQFWRTDGWLYQTLVGLLAVNALMSWGSNWAFLFVNVIVALENPAILITRPGYMTIPVFSPIFASCCSEVFFVVRTWRLWNRKKWMLPILSLFPLGHLGIGLVGIIYQIGFPQYSVLQSGLVPHKLEQVLSATFIVTAATDIVLTSMLIIGLHRKEYRENRGFSQRTDNVIKRLLRLSVTTAFITTCLAITGAIILRTTDGTKWINLVDIIAFPVPHTTALVVVGTLNLRRKITARNPSQQTPVRWTDSTGSGYTSGSNKRAGSEKVHFVGPVSGAPQQQPHANPVSETPSWNRGRASSASSAHRTSPEFAPADHVVVHTRQWTRDDYDPNSGGTELLAMPAVRTPVAVTLRTPSQPRDGPGMAL